MRFTSSPTSAAIPNSSSSSRRMASRGCSPSSILPPGNSHLSGIGWCRVLWQARIRSSFKISAATTLFMLLRNTFRDNLEINDLLGDGAVLLQPLAAHKDWHDDLGLGFEGASKIAWIIIYVVHHHRLPRRCRRATDALI